MTLRWAAVDPQQAAAEVMHYISGWSRALPGALGRKSAFEFPILRQAMRAGAGVKLGCDHTHDPAQVAIRAETLASRAGNLS